MPYAKLRQYGGALPVYTGQAYQYGGAFIPVYSGESYQYGEGLGDILRGVGRFLFPIIAPIVTRAASSFVNNTASNLNSGQSWRDASVNSLTPLLEDTIDEAKETVLKRRNGIRRKQSGSGKRRVYKNKYKRAKRIRRINFKENF